MGGRSAPKLRDLVRSQHGVLTRTQLLDAGLTRKSISHRLDRGRIRPLYAGVYAVGQLDLSRHGRWMAAVLACGPGAVLSLTRTELERLFLPIARRAGLPLPETNVRVNGYEVDFLFRDLGLVVETDGGRFHRSAIKQTRDRRREHAHLAAGMLPVRFTHWQVRYEPADAGKTLERAARMRAATVRRADRRAA